MEYRPTRIGDQHVPTHPRSGDHLVLPQIVPRQAIAYGTETQRSTDDDGQH